MYHQIVAAIIMYTTLGVMIVVRFGMKGFTKESIMRLPWHRHEWTELERGFFQVREGGWGATTIITYTCTCRNYKQTKLDGHVKKGIQE